MTYIWPIHYIYKTSKTFPRPIWPILSHLEDLLVLFYVSLSLSNWIWIPKFLIKAPVWKLMIVTAPCDTRVLWDTWPSPEHVHVLWPATTIMLLLKSMLLILPQHWTLHLNTKTPDTRQNLKFKTSVVFLRELSSISSYIYRSKMYKTKNILAESN